MPSKSESEPEEARGEISARAVFYGWLAQILVREIQPDVWDELRRDPIRPILDRLEPELGQQLADGLDARDQERLAEEFARLFLLPGGVSPLAASWLGPADDRDRTRDRIAALVEQSFRATEREPVDREPWGRLARDHLAVILDLVAQAQRSQDPEHREVASQLDRQLLRPALASFGPALSERAKEPLYRAIGLLVLSLESLESAD